MRKFLLALTISLLVSPVAFAIVSGVTEEDGAPDAYPWQIKFSNGSVTDNGDGTVTVNNGSGSGDSVTVNSTSVDTTANLLDSSDIQWTLNDGGPGGPDDITAAVNWDNIGSISSLTASEIVITDGSKNLVSAAVATYPSLTELTYLKGVTSAIQTQFSGKEASVTWGAGLANSGGTATTASGEADFLASGALTCGASTQGKAQVHTTPLQYCDNAATPALQYAAYGASDGDALAGDSASSFFDAGAIEAARGGTGGDSSASTGIARVDSGTWSYAELSGEATTSGSNAVTLADSVAVSSWTITTPIFSGAIDADGGAVNDDDCTGQIGQYWFDDTDNAFEFCNADSGTPSTLGGASFSTLDSDYGAETITSDFDFGGGTLQIPNSTTLPASCEVGDSYMDTDATTGQRFYLCESANTWALQGDGGGGGTTFNEVPLPIHSAKLIGSFVTDGDATAGAGINSGNGPWELLFDATTDEAAVWQFKMPNNYSSSPILEITYKMASATSGTVEFEGAIMCVSDGDSADVGTASFSTIAVGSATVPGTAGYPDKINITLTDDSCAADDDTFIYLSTDADDATNDSATGDREVTNVTFSYTAS